MSDALTQRIVRELLDYDPDTGVLTWRWRARKWFGSDRIWHSWNAKHAGKRAFTAIDTYGHAHGSLLGHLYRAHRIIWLWMTGRWPTLEIDHLNHRRDDNRWCNLEDAPGEVNIARRRRSGPQIDTSGSAGVPCGNTHAATLLCRHHQCERARRSSGYVSDT